MYKTINGWTKKKMSQAIMERMLDHRSVGPARGHNPNQCRYRASDGNRCAVGVFIPDELYTTDMDTIVTSYIKPFPWNGGPIDALMPLPILGLMELQHVHDDYTGPGPDPRPALLAWINENVEDAL